LRRVLDEQESPQESSRYEHRPCLSQGLRPRYTERKPAFFTYVRRIGYFVRVIPRVHTDAHWGKRTTLFWDKLHTSVTPGTEASKSGTVYHRSPAVSTRQIDRENIRNSREHEIDQSSGALECHFCSLIKGYQYLETSPKSRFSASN